MGTHQLVSKPYDPHFGAYGSPISSSHDVRRGLPEEHRRPPEERRPVEASDPWSHGCPQSSPYFSPQTLPPQPPQPPISSWSSQIGFPEDPRDRIMEESLQSLQGTLQNIDHKLQILDNWMDFRKEIYPSYFPVEPTSSLPPTPQQQYETSPSLPQPPQQQYWSLQQPEETEPKVFDKVSVRKLGSISWCRRCKIECESMEGLVIHSLTSEHQNRTMTLVLSIKQNIQSRQQQDVAPEENINEVPSCIEEVGVVPVPVSVTAVQEEAPQKPYASIVKVMEDNSDPLAVPKPTVRPAPPYHEQQSVPTPELIPPPEVPSASSIVYESSIHGTKVDGYSIDIKGFTAKPVSNQQTVISPFTSIPVHVGTQLGMSTPNPMLSLEPNLHHQQIHVHTRASRGQLPQFEQGTPLKQCTETFQSSPLSAAAMLEKGKAETITSAISDELNDGKPRRVKNGRLYFFDLEEETEKKTLEDYKNDVAKPLAPVNSFQQLSSSQNAFIGNVGTWFGFFSFSFGTIVKEDPAFGSSSGAEGKDCFHVLVWDPGRIEIHLVVVMVSDKRHFVLEGAQKETRSLHASVLQYKLKEKSSIPNIGQLEEAWSLLRLFPICATCLVFGTIYGCVLAPKARRFSKNLSSFTILQKIGTGIAFSIVSMVVVRVWDPGILQTLHSSFKVQYRASSSVSVA